MTIPAFARRNAARRRRPLGREVRQRRIVQPPDSAPQGAPVSRATRSKASTFMPDASIGTPTSFSPIMRAQLIRPGDISASHSTVSPARGEREQAGEHAVDRADVIEDAFGR